RRHPRRALVPYPTLFRSEPDSDHEAAAEGASPPDPQPEPPTPSQTPPASPQSVARKEPWRLKLTRTLLYGKNVDRAVKTRARGRSEEHTSELQSPDHLVC